MKKIMQKKMSYLLSPEGLTNCGSKYKASLEDQEGHVVVSNLQKKSGSSKYITCFEFKELGHYKNEGPKLKKERSKQKVFRGKNKMIDGYLG